MLTALRALARRIRVLETEAADHERAMRAIVRSWRPDLLELSGVGPIVAATVLTAWSHPGRCRSDAAFAMLAGAAPIPASSGKTVRHRLNRAGNRQLNRALHTVALSRLQHDPATRDYADQTPRQGKTDREIKRCLKRYIARQLFRQLENPVAGDRRRRGAGVRAARRHLERRGDPRAGRGEAADVRGRRVHSRRPGAGGVGATELHLQRRAAASSW